SIQPDPSRILEIRDGHPKAYGLELRVFPSGEKRWAIRYRNANGRQRRLTLGPYPLVPLGGKNGARDKAEQSMLQVKNGQDPAEKKKERREADTVAEFAQVYMDRYAIGPGGK